MTEEITVKELIEELKKMPMDSPVYWTDGVMIRSIRNEPELIKSGDTNFRKEKDLPIVLI